MEGVHVFAQKHCSPCRLSWGICRFFWQNPHWVQDRHPHCSHIHLHPQHPRTSITVPLTPDPALTKTWGPAGEISWRTSPLLHFQPIENSFPMFSFLLIWKFFHNTFLQFLKTYYSCRCYLSLTLSYKKINFAVSATITQGESLIVAILPLAVPYISRASQNTTCYWAILSWKWETF